MIEKRGEIDFDSISKAIKKNAHKMVGTLAVNQFKTGFTTGGGKTDASVGGWKRRKNNSDPGRATLVKSGNLRRSIRIGSSNPDHVKIVANMHYASYHNEGTRNLPKRNFIGDSRVLDRRIELGITRIMDTATKSAVKRNVKKTL